MHQKDLEIHSYDQQQDLKVLAFGWLDRSVQFETGVNDERVIEFLKNIKPGNLYRGYHVCNICKASERPVDERIWVKIGNGDRRFKTRDGITYVAPNMIMHYIEHHKYLVPAVVSNAVLQKLGLA